MIKQNGIPIIGQIPDYAFGVVMALPHTPEQSAHLKSQVAAQRARLAKGEVAVIMGDKFKCFSIEEFVALVFGGEQDDVDKLAQSVIIKP